MWPLNQIKNNIEHLHSSTFTPEVFGQHFTYINTRSFIRIVSSIYFIIKTYFQKDICINTMFDFLG